MKATTPLGELLPALEHAERAVSTRSSVQILQAFRLEVSDRLIVVGTDMETIIRADVGLMPGRRRGVAVVGPARQIVQALKTLPSGAVVRLEKKGDELVVTSARTTLKFRLGEAEDYPALPTPESLVATVATKDLVAAYGHVSTCYSTDVSRPVLCGIKLELEVGVVRLAATDSYRLGVVEAGAEVAEPFEAIVPGSALAEVVHITKGAESVEIHQSERHVWFLVGGTSLAARKIDGQFPNWRQLRPDEFQPHGKPALKISLNREQALESCNRILKLRGQYGSPMRLTAAPGAKQVTFGLVDLGKGISVEDIVEATVSGKERFEVGLHPGFVGDALANAQAESVHLRLISPLRALFISGNDEDNPDRWMIVMPIRLA